MIHGPYNIKLRNNHILETNSLISFALLITSFNCLTFVVAIVALCRWSNVKISDLWLRLAMEAERNVRTWHASVSWSHFLLDIRKCLTLGMKWVMTSSCGCSITGLYRNQKPPFDTATPQTLSGKAEFIIQTHPQVTMVLHFHSAQEWKSTFVLITYRPVLHVMKTCEPCSLHLVIVAPLKTSVQRGYVPVFTFLCCPLEWTFSVEFPCNFVLWRRVENLTSSKSSVESVDGWYIWGAYFL